MASQTHRWLKPRKGQTHLPIPTSLRLLRELCSNVCGQLYSVDEMLDCVQLYVIILAFRMSEYRKLNNLSLKLSEVMDEMGVNEKITKITRESFMLSETMMSMSANLIESNYFKSYFFGSQPECSTTMNMYSDIDFVQIHQMFCVKQDLEECQSVENLLMIQNEKIPPGYCHLQCFTSDWSDDYKKQHGDETIESEGLLFLKPSVLTEKAKSYGDEVVNGPAVRIQISPPIEIDIVPGFSCDSFQLETSLWSQNQRERKWPSDDILNLCRASGCFVVPTDSKISDAPEIEWRISTSLQERYLMFSLNITQLRCYILLKMIVKTHINTIVKDVLSSFMCKNVVLYCIAYSSHEWNPGNLLSCLHSCLFMLRERILQRNCPHFIIPENNLLSMRMTDTQRYSLLNILANLLLNHRYMYLIWIQKKFDPRIRVQRPRNKTNSIMLNEVLDKAAFMFIILDEANVERIEEAQRLLLQIIESLTRYGTSENRLEQIASGLAMPFAYSAMGTVTAWKNIQNETAVGEKAYNYLLKGENSDVLAGKLKHATVLYRTGDMTKTEMKLKDIREKYYASEFTVVCCCYVIHQRAGNVQYFRAALNQSINKMKNGGKDYMENSAFCVGFLLCEMDFVPHELRYEILNTS